MSNFVEALLDNLMEPARVKAAPVVHHLWTIARRKASWWKGLHQLYPHDM